MPVVYSSSEKCGLNNFASYLDNLGLKYIVLHTEPRNCLKKEKNQAIKKSYPLYKPERYLSLSLSLLNKLRLTLIDPSHEMAFNPTLKMILNLYLYLKKTGDAPICVLLHPDMTEGIDLKFNPAVLYGTRRYFW